MEFATGSPTVPLDGFANLKGMGGNIMKFTIEPYICYGSDDPYKNEFRLIEAKTCFNRIILPYYKNKNEIKKALDIILNASDLLTFTPLSFLRVLLSDFF